MIADCPGTDSEQAGKASACEGCPNQAVCASAPKGPDPDLLLIASRLKDVRNIILVLSGKGGVGKSTVSAQLAFSLADKGFEVGLLDIDICGPSMPKMLGLEGREIHQSSSGWSPVYVEENLGVMSIGFLLNNPDDAVIWRGPRKNALIKQFLKDVDWGSMDYLVIDAPPGTSDEHISVVQFLLPSHEANKNLAGAVIVTTPQEVSLIDVRKEINFCTKTGVNVIGVVENMSGFTAPVASLAFVDADGRDVSEAVQEVLQKTAGSGLTAQGNLLFTTCEGAKQMAEKYDVPFLGRIPLDLEMSKAAEEGRSVFDDETGKNTASARSMATIIDQLIKLTSKK